jgi:hypothetical protein
MKCREAKPLGTDTFRMRSYSTVATEAKGASPLLIPSKEHLESKSLLQQGADGRQRLVMLLEEPSSA